MMDKDSGDVIKAVEQIIDAKMNELRADMRAMLAEQRGYINRTLEGRTPPREERKGSTSLLEDIFG